VKGLRKSVMSEKKSGKGKGWRGNWRDRFDIPKADAEPVLLVPGEYADERPDSIKDNGGEAPLKHYGVHPFHSYKDNVRGKDVFMKRRCAAGWTGDDGECIGCHRKDSGDRRVGYKRAVYSLNALHLNLYEKKPIKNKEGKVMRFEEDGENHKRGDSIKSWQPITRPKDMKNALINLEEMMEEGTLQMCRKKYIEVGKGHLDNLMIIEEMANKRCMCGGELTPVLFTCPECGEVLCDVEDSRPLRLPRHGVPLRRVRRRLRATQCLPGRGLRPKDGRGYELHGHRRQDRPHL